MHFFVDRLISSVAVTEIYVSYERDFRSQKDI